MKIKKGDNVIVLSGKDKGKKSKVVKAYPKESMVLLEGLNMRKKHERARRANQKGQIIDIAMPLAVSKVALIDPKSGKATRIGMRINGDKKIRVAVKSGETI